MCRHQQPCPGRRGEGKEVTICFHSKGKDRVAVCRCVCPKECDTPEGREWEGTIKQKGRLCMMGPVFSRASQPSGSQICLQERCLDPELVCFPRCCSLLSSSALQTLTVNPRTLDDLFLCSKILLLKKK